MPEPATAAHRPVNFYADCMHTPPDEDDTSDAAAKFWDEHFYVGEDGILTCEAACTGKYCAACSQAAYEASDGDLWDPVPWPCPYAPAEAVNA